MKLRNKKTGEIIDDGYVRETHDFQFDGQTHVLAVFKGHGHRPPERVSGAYASLAELNAEWEDYAPKGPLIKDEKIRKAVRAWLAIQGQPIVAAAITRSKDSDGFFNYRLYGYIEKARISDGKPVVNNNLTAIDFVFRSLEKIEFDRNRDYTIAELCGEEEE